MDRTCRELSAAMNPARQWPRPKAAIAMTILKAVLPFLIFWLTSGLLDAQVRRPGNAGAGTATATRRVETKDRAGDGRLWRIKGRDAHEARWEQMVVVTNPTTRTVQMRTNAFAVLAAGLHYSQGGQWLESRDEIEIVDGGAVARHGAHRVAFDANINRAGAIDFLTPEGHRLRSHVLGIAYSDAASGKSILVGGIRDSIGLVNGNQVSYPDALDGTFRADVRYTYSISGFEQDIVLMEQPPSPSEYGLDPRTTRLEVWTEFVQPPVPNRIARTLKASPPASKGAAVTGPGLTDETLSFGSMMIGSGTAFPLENGFVSPSDGGPVAVGKEWLNLEGRTFLIEKVDYSDIEGELSRLPRAGLARKSRRAIGVPAQRHAMLAGLTAPPAVEVAEKRGRMEFTAHRAPTSGYVVDYSIVATLPNQVFRGDSTYLVVGSCVLSGTTVIEGGAVVKFTNGIKNGILVTGPIDCQTSAYRPAYFVSMNDDTVGELIPGSTGDAWATSPGGGFEFDWRGGIIQLHDLRLRSLERALVAGNGTSVTLSHSQIQGCNIGVQTLSGSAAWIRNALFVDISSVGFMLAVGSQIRGEHLTLHRVGSLRNTVYGIPTGVMELANSLLVTVGNLSTRPDYTWRKVFFEPRGTGIFEKVGHGNHYLVPDSPYRGAGDSNVDPNLLQELRNTTTYPPVVLSGVIQHDAVLRPMVPRNAVAGVNPDVGYAYDAMDYLLRGISVEGKPGTPTTLLATNGVILGLDPSVSGSGIHLGPYSSLVSAGRPAALNRILPLQVIQEGVFAGPTWSFSQIHGVGLGDYPKIFLRFTELNVPAGRTRHFANWGGFPHLGFQDCRFAGGELYLSPDSPSHVVGVTNSSFERVRFTFHPYARATLHIYNSLFKNGAFAIDLDPPNPPGSAAWSIRDNLFDGTHVSQLTELSAGAATHNAYVLASHNPTRLRPLPPDNSDRILSASPGYEAIGDRRYYLPAGDVALTDKGSRSAAAAGLYHYTTRAGQTKEGLSTVDIGLHYVAFSGNDARDADQDGSSDYVEDANGDGITRGVEARWDAYESPYRLTGRPGLSVFTPIK